ncbi:glycosyltransferase [Enterococcus lactis]
MESLKNFNNINFKYLICGEGASRERLQSLIKQYKLEDKVELLGFRTDILELLKISDYFIFPSKREGLPVSIMEALACGVPVICSKIRGN